MKSAHKQVPVKVTAFVDAGISGLVELLNTFGGVYSFESCEGRDEELAYIYLRCRVSQGISINKTINYAHRIAVALSEVLEQQESIIPKGYDIRISVQWWGDKKLPFISVELPRTSVEDAISIFSAVKQQFFCDT